MRFVIFGAGGIGGVLGGRLFENGYDVALIARGEHGRVINERGLRVESPDRTVTLSIETVAAPSDLEWRDGDVVVLSMKTQDTVPALADLARRVPASTPIVCAQNGVANERMALRLFPNVYGVCVMCPTTFLEPGVVQAQSSPTTGIMDVGRYPAGVDEIAVEIADAFTKSTYVADARPDIMRAKYQKLLMNLANAVEAVCGSGTRGGELAQRVRAEGHAALRAAGIDYASDEEDVARRGNHLTMRPINGQRRSGGSSWQSLARGARTIETDYLNGEIVLLGRLHGVPTPANELLQAVARQLAESGAPPGAVTPEELLARLEHS